MRSFIGLSLSLITILAFVACGTGGAQNGAQDPPDSPNGGALNGETPNGEAPNGETPDGDRFGEPFPPQETPPQQGDALATPDVVAIVEGEEISGEEFDARLEQMIASYQQQGMMLEGEQLAQVHQQAVQSLVQERLLLQRATESGIEVSNEEVEAQYQQLAQEFGGEEALFQAAEAQGIPADNLRDFLSEQLKIEQLLDVAIEEADLNPPSDQEIQAMYDQLNQQSGQQLPDLAEIEEDIIAELQARERQQVQQAFVQELEEASDVEILLDPEPVG